MPKLDILVCTKEADGACSAGSTQLLAGLRLTPRQTPPLSSSGAADGYFWRLGLFFKKNEKMKDK
jgi:hypothetical protein